MPSSQAVPSVGQAVPTQPQIPSATSFSVAALPSSQAVPSVGQAVPAQLQSPSSTSFSVLASPSSHDIPAAGQAAAQDNDSSKLFKVPFPTAFDPSLGSLLLKLVLAISNDKLLV